MELKPYARSPTRPTKRELQVVEIFSLWKTGTHLPHKFDTITADELVMQLIRELSAVA